MSISQLLSSDEQPNQRRNGIQNLLNDDYEQEKYEMADADTDTDTEDHVIQEPTTSASIDNASLETQFETKVRYQKNKEKSD